MIRLLIDTHALLWWLIDDPQLTTAARGAIEDPANTPLVSTASVWEVAIKRSLGKLETPDDLPERITGEGFEWLPVSAEHAWQARNLPPHHRDPFDRLIVAQAMVDRLPVVTGDAQFDAYGVTTYW